MSGDQELSSPEVNAWGWVVIRKKGFHFPRAHSGPRSGNQDLGVSSNRIKFDALLWQLEHCAQPAQECDASPCQHAELAGGGTDVACSEQLHGFPGFS